MSRNGPWARIRHGRLAQAVGVYLAISWIILQVVGEARDAIGLPDWVGPVSFLLLAIGLLVVLATAWVQGRPLADRDTEPEVPGSWALEVSEIRSSLRKGEIPHLNWTRAILGGVFAFSLLFGLAGLYVVVRDRGESFAPEEAIAGAAADAVAVLPFEVSGAELGDWREGMVNLLATNLDGAGGLRAIHHRTVLARWDRDVGPQGRADEGTSLRVAGETGARWAVLGDAIAIGPRVRLTAAVYEVRSGDKLGEARAEGDPDAVLELVDDLSIDLLAILLEDAGEVPAVDLGGVTSRSVAAVKAYLEGQTAQRAADFGGAISAYQRAVEADSLFALAYFNLAESWGWNAAAQDERAVENRERALALADRLPQREALLVRQSARLHNRIVADPAIIDTLRQLTRRFPDDPRAWYELGEAGMHGAMTRIPLEEIRGAFGRAVELDPGFAPYRIHLVDLAFADLDSAAAARELEAYETLVGRPRRRARLALAFLHGDSAARKAAEATLDTLPERALGTLVAALMAPADARLYDRRRAALERLTARMPAEGAAAFRGTLLAQQLWQTGRYEEPTDGAAPVDAWSACPGWSARREGLPVPVEVIPPASAEADPFALLCAAFDAADEGRFETADSLGAAFHGFQETVAREFPRFVPLFQALERALDGYVAWRRGRPEEALETLGRLGNMFPQGSGIPLGHVVGDLQRELGREAEAIESYRSVWLDPLASLKLGRIHEARGDTEEALEAYRYFVGSWADADPGFRFLVEEAETRILALTDARQPDGGR